MSEAKSIKMLDNFNNTSVSAILESFSCMDSVFEEINTSKKDLYSNRNFNLCTPKERDEFINKELFDCNILVTNSIKDKMGTPWNWSDIYKLVYDPTYASVDKLHRKAMFPTSSTSRPIGEVSYSMWNGFQIIDLDIKDAELARDLKQDLFNDLSDFNWFLGITLSASKKGLHIWTKITPSTFTPEHRKKEFKVNFRYKYSYVYLILRKYAKKHGYTEQAIEQFIDMAMCKPQQASFIPSDNTAMMSTNFVDTRIDVNFQKAFDTGSEQINNWITHPRLKEIFERLDWFAEDQDTSSDTIIASDIENTEEWDTSKNKPRHYKYNERWKLANTLTHIYGRDKAIQLLIDITTGTPKGELISICQTASTHNKPIDTWGVVQLNKYHGFNLKLKETEEGSEARVKTMEKIVEDALKKDDLIDPTRILNSLHSVKLNIKSNQYLSDIQDDIINNLEHISLLEAGAGYGKTEMIKRLKGRVLLVLPFTSTIKAKIEADAATSDWLYYYGSKQVDFSDLTMGDKSMAMTIDKFSRLNIHEVNVSNFDYIVVDESHLLFTSSYRDVMSPAISRIANSKSKVLLMTGTPTGEVLFFPKIKHIKVIKEDHREKELHVKFYPTDVEKEIEMCKDMANDIINGKKILYPTNKGTLHYQKICGLIQNYLNAKHYPNPLNAFYYKKSNTGDAEMDSINIDKSIGNVDLVCCTSYLSVGVDICDKYNFKIYFSETFIPQDVEQYANRIRNNNLYINLYLPKFDSEGRQFNYTSVSPLNLSYDKSELLMLYDYLTHCNDFIRKNSDEPKYNPIVKSILATGRCLKYDENYGQYYIDETKFKLDLFDRQYNNYYKQLPKLTEGMEYYGYTIKFTDSIVEASEMEREELKQYVRSCRKTKYNKDTENTFTLINHITDENIDIYKDILRGNYEICKSSEYQALRTDNDLYVEDIEILEKNIPIIVSLYKYYDIPTIRQIYEHCRKTKSNIINFSQLGRIRRFANIEASMRKKRLDFPVYKFVQEATKWAKEHSNAARKDIDMYIAQYAANYANSVEGLIVEDNEYYNNVFNIIKDLWKVIIIEGNQRKGQIPIKPFEMLWERKDVLHNLYGDSLETQDFFIDLLIDELKDQEPETEEEIIPEFEHASKFHITDKEDEVNNLVSDNYDFFDYSEKDGSNKRFMEKQENTTRTIVLHSNYEKHIDKIDKSNSTRELTVFSNNEEDNGDLPF